MKPKLFNFHESKPILDCIDKKILKVIKTQLDDNQLKLFSMSLESIINDRVSKQLCIFDEKIKLQLETFLETVIATQISDSMLEKIARN